MRTTLACLLFVLGPVCAEDALDAALSKLRTVSRADTDAAVRAVMERKPERAAVLARLKRPFAVAAQQAGWQALSAVDEKGVARPFEMYVPESLVGKVEPVPLVIAMHGGVSRPEFIATPGQRSTAALWVQSADAEGFILACPAGRADCVWWSDAGVRHVRAVIREAKRQAPIDDNAIFGTGFSDGGSGCYYLAMAEPRHFAGFLPMNGHPAVAASASRKDLFVENLGVLPQFIAMTQDDQLYPAITVLPHLEEAIKAGARMHIVNYPRGGHRPVYFEEQRAAFARFVTDTPREEHPRTFRWKCADPAQGRVAWAQILAVGKSEEDPAASLDRNVVSMPGRVRIGISVDQAFEGEGVRITQVSKKTLAESLKLAAGDVIVGMDEQAIGGLADLRRALGGKKYGDAVALSVVRNEEKLEVSGRFPEFTPQPIYRRDGIRAEFALQSEGQQITIRCRNVRRLRLLLPDELFGAEPIAVTVNGKPVVPALREIPVEEILRAYASDADSGFVHGREATIDVR